MDTIKDISILYKNLFNIYVASYGLTLLMLRVSTLKDHHGHELGPEEVAGILGLIL